MNKSIIIVYTLLCCVFIHTQAQVEEHDPEEIAAIVSELVGDMVSIPGGTFRMGDLSGEGDSSEKPVRSVTVSAFEMGKYEVTATQWGACVADGGCEYTRYGDIIIIPGPDDPVVEVFPDDAQDFIDWLNSKTGGNFRLPSEAEWEYAARAGTTTKYSWGDDIGHDQANCDGCGSWWGDRWLTAPVGSFPANAWGLHDMHGNVWEWVQDCWHDSYEGAPTDGSAWGRTNCDGYTIRGGSYDNEPSSLRSASRDTFTEPLISIGFRLAQSALTVPSQASVTPQPQNRTNTLHNAATAGDLEMLKAVITAGADVNARDSRGWTALMHAVDKGHVLLVSQLLEAQANVNLRARDRSTALFIAAAHGHTEIIELLMKAGADVTRRGPMGKTPVEMVRTRYGDANASRKNREAAAVLALLGGKTWAEVEEERAQVEPTVKQLVEEMVSIPAGSFRMGDLSGEGDDDEKPAHTVTVPAFRLGKYEVTFAQWDACVTDGECGGYAPYDGYIVERGRGRGNRPVMNVSWNDAQLFIDWLNSKTGGGYRLPTEAEWEYAARAGTTTEYSWGNDIGSNRANCVGDLCGDQWEFSAPVGSFPANAWGLHDMHGNVAELAQDCLNDGYEGAPTDGSAWESGYCSLRMVRGGYWFLEPGHLRSATRGRISRSYRASAMGFRLAQDE